MDGIIVKNSVTMNNNQHPPWIDHFLIFYLVTIIEKKRKTKQEKRGKKNRRERREGILEGDGPIHRISAEITTVCPPPVRPAPIETPPPLVVAPRRDHRSEPDDLGGAHDGVLPGDGVPADGLVVEAAVVAVRVAVRAAEELPAAAPEPRQPDALPAALAPVDGRLRSRRPTQ